MGKISKRNKNICGMTVLQLNGEGANGGAVFTDSSLSEHANPTRVGGTNIVTTNATDPFGGTKGVISFPGVGKEYLSYPANDDFDVGTSEVGGNDFTIEFQAYFTADHQMFIINCETFGQWHIRLGSLTNNGPWIMRGSSEILVGITDETFSLNTWYHFAFTKEGTTYRVFLDGILRSTNVTESLPYSVPKSLHIGMNPGASPGEGMHGYLSNIRILRDLALYTENFSVPTIPHPKCFKPTDIPSLVCWLDPNKISSQLDATAVTTFIDRSGNSNDFTQATAANKPTFQTNEVNGRAVVRFDGSNDFLQAVSKVLPIGPKTIVTVSKVSASGLLLAENEGIVGNHGLELGVTGSLIYADSTNGSVRYTTNAKAGTTNSGIPTITIHQWDGSISGGKVRTLSDGKLITLDTAAAIETLAGAVNTVLGSDSSGTSTIAGDILEVLVFNSELTDQDKNRLDRYLAAKYTLSITPTKLCMKDAGYENQVLLLHGEGPNTEGNVLDSSDSNHTVTSTGVTHITSDKPFGFSSLEFNGSSDYLEIADSPDWDINATDFTIECWFKQTGYPVGGGGDGAHIFNQGIDTSNGNPSNSLQCDANSLLWAQGPANELFISATGQTLTLGVWYHVACVKEGLTGRLYLDGKLIGTDTWPSEPTNLGNTLKIGRGRVPTGDAWGYFEGGMKEFRWVKGTAVYTENFRPKRNFYCD